MLVYIKMSFLVSVLPKIFNKNHKILFYKTIAQPAGKNDISLIGDIV
jgi:hypothetical protein